MTHAAESVQAQLDAIAATERWGVEALEAILGAAADAKASDLHLQAQRESVLVRVRIQGELRTIAAVPAARRELLFSRLKVLAKLPGFVRHEPQDGRMEYRSADGGARLLRVAFLPTIHGETAVVRFPERDATPRSLEALGMSAEVRAGVERFLRAPEGTVLVTGPSGSGKTTTLHAMLQRLHEREGDTRHIVTIEDPVERDLGFATQVQVADAQGLGFAVALRAALRQDPNVLLIGEVRDAETAQVCVQAGMTGHLVLSTLHAGRASRVFTRLLSMGIEPYLVASALHGAIAQRLVRRACPRCRPDDSGGAVSCDGCEHCGHTGHAGRLGIFELCGMSESLREAILARATPDRIAAEARGQRVGDLEREAIRLRGEGTIAAAECALVTGSVDFIEEENS